MSNSAVTPVSFGTLLTASGTYTPVNTATLNLDSAPTAFTANYLRVGNVVVVSGKVTIDPTGGGDVTWDMTLPFASTFTNEEDLSGTLQLVDNTSYIHGIKANTSNGKATFEVNAGFTTAKSGHFIFMYQVK